MQLCPLYQQATVIPTRIAVIDRQASVEMSYQELDQHCSALMQLCEAAGIKKGAVVGFLAKRTAHTIALCFALWRLEAIAMPLPTTMAGEERETRQSECDFWLPASCIESIRRDGAKSSKVYWNLAAPAICLLSSGSTAHPKKVVHTLESLYYNTLGFLQADRYPSPPHWLLNLPLNHVSGLSILLRAMLAGGTLLVAGHRKQELSSLILQEKISHIAQVPTQLFRWIANENRFPRCLHRLLVGGDKTAPWLLKKALEGGLPIAVCYGSTEIGATFCWRPADSIVDFSPNDIGKPLPFRYYTLKEQELYAGGPTLLAGYQTSSGLRNAPHAPFILPRFATGDLFRMTKEGTLLFIGRKDRRFIWAGENIAPEEIEWQMIQHPAILAAHVYPVFDIEFGQKPHAKLISLDNNPNLAEEIKWFLKSRLPSFKIPVTITIAPPHFLASAPKKWC